MPSRSYLALVVLAAFVAAPVQASAEWFFDLYGGYTWTQPSNLDVTKFDSSGASVRHELRDVEFDRSPVAGARAGYWLGVAPVLGLALDAFYFRPDIPTQRVRVTGRATPITFQHEDVSAAVVGLDVLVRVPLLPSAGFPNGQVQPYLTAGPSVLITEPEALGTSVGFKVGAGVSWLLTQHVAIFGEYRFTRYTPEVDTRGLRYEGDVRTHHTVGGISFRF